MTGALGLGLTRDFGLGVGIGLLVALAFYVLKQVVPWEYQRYREKKNTKENLTEELWFYLDRVIRQWERRQALFTSNQIDDTETVLAEQAHADLKTALDELTKFLEGATGTIDRERIRDIDEASRDLQDVCLALQGNPDDDYRGTLEARGDKAHQRLKKTHQEL